MTEAELFNKIISPYFVKQGRFVYHIDYNRVPDVYTSFMVDKKHLMVWWYELKVVRRPRKDGSIKPTYQPGQRSFAYDQKILSGVDNISLIVYIESTKEARLYIDLQKVYTKEDYYININKWKL